MEKKDKQDLSFFLEHSSQADLLDYANILAEQLDSVVKRYSDRGLTLTYLPSKLFFWNKHWNRKDDTELSIGLPSVSKIISDIPWQGLQGKYKRNLFYYLSDLSEDLDQFIAMITQAIQSHEYSPTESELTLLHEISRNPGFSPNIRFGLRKALRRH